jgi:hypothetical protein
MPYHNTFIQCPKLTSNYFSDDEFEMFDNSFFSKQQHAIENRIKQEKEDAELARSLQTGNEGPASAVLAAADRLVGPSAFDRLSGARRPPPATTSTSTNPMQRILTNYSRNGPYSESPSASNVKREEPSSSSGMGSRAYHENSFYNMNRGKADASSSRTMPGAFTDDSSTASDSDIEIIDPEAFHDNGRHPSTPSGSSISSSRSLFGAQQSRMHHPSFSPEAQTAGEASLRRVQQGPVYTALHTPLYNHEYLPSYLRNHARPLPNSSQNSSLPGSYPHPGVGIRSNATYGSPQVYENGGDFLGNNGMYSGHPGVSMHNSGPDREYSLNVSAGTALGHGYINQPSPFIGAGGAQNSNPFSRPDHMSDIFNRPMDLQMANQYDYIMNDPRKTNDEIKTLLENIRPDVELPMEDREGTPDGLVYPLVS